MPTIYTNIEVQQIRQQIKYPFTYDSTCCIGNQYLDTSNILSLSLCIQKANFPLFISTISKQEDIIKLILQDTNRTQIAIIQLKPCTQNDSTTGINTNVILDLHGNVIGTITTKNADFVYNYFASFLINRQNLFIQIPTTSFMIDSRCIKCIYNNDLTAVTVDQNYLQGRINIYFKDNCILSAPEIEPAYISIKGDIDTSYNKIVKLQNIKIKKLIKSTDANGKEVVNQQVYDLSDAASKNIVIKHTMLSDLRVVTEQRSISLVGVQNVN